MKQQSMITCVSPPLIILTIYSHRNFQAAEIHITFHITLEQESQEMLKKKKSYGTTDHWKLPL
jgi:hypothetical protein